MIQQERYLKAKKKQKRINKIRESSKGLVYELDDQSAIFWKNGELVAHVRFRFGTKMAKELFKGKQRKLKKVM